MEAPNRFRSAFNGFNREDVVNYISYISNVHETETNQLRSEAEELRQECEQLRLQLAQQEDVPALREELEQLRLELEERDARIVQLEAPVEPEEPEEPECYTQEDELTAYRRAERVERMAQERVNKMVDEAHQALTQAGTVLDGSTAHLDELAEQVRSALVALEEAIGESQNTMAQVAESIHGIRIEIE